MSILYYLYSSTTYYICGTYPGKEENERLWKQVQEYIEEHYERDRIKKIYFQSDGGSWMKKGMERLGSAFVLDEFHLEKYKKKARKGIKEEEKEEAENERIEAMKQSKKQAILKWKEKWTAGGENKKAEEGIQYRYNHWDKVYPLSRTFL